MTIRGGRAIGGIAQGGGGGGVFGTSGARVALRDCTITGNSSSFNGAGVLIQEDALLVLERCLVTANGPTTFGGGITVTSVGNGMTATVRDAIVTGNTCTSEKCGVDVQTADMVVVRTTISDNAGATNAGGIGIDRGLLTVIESTVTGNRAANGAGLFARDSGAIALWRSTVSGNLADNQGGGAFVSAGSSLDMIDSTVTANRAYAGGGLYGAGGARNTILAGNLHLGGGGADCAGSVLSSGSNLIQATSGCAISGATGSDITGVAPGVNALADNGGPTETHALAPGSPAIDHGAGCSGTDQRGYSRPADGDGDGTSTCDIGAYEADGSEVADPCGNGVIDPGEDCDDDGLCCGPTCQFDPAGTPCGPPSQCSGSQCDGAGICANALLPDGSPCSDGSPCTADACRAGSCISVAAPSSTCRQQLAPRGQFALSDPDGENADKLFWRWQKGEATTAEEFAQQDYYLCVYDFSSGASTLVTHLATHGDVCVFDCWKLRGQNKIYVDVFGTHDGLRQIYPKPRGDGAAGVQVQARGENLPMPSLPLTPPVTVQLVSEAGDCWSATYSAPTRNDAEKFQAKPDP